MTGPFDEPIFPGKHLEIRSGYGVCDFCSPPQPSEWVYPCKSFTLPMPARPFGRTPLSDGDWGACKECAELIEANDRPTLVRRCGYTFVEIAEIQRATINLFFKNRKGRRYYVGGQEHELFDGALVVTPTDEGVTDK